jgi:hypothetical protein
MSTKRGTEILIYDRYRHCVGGKYDLLVEKIEGTFGMHVGGEVVLVDSATCDGSPDGNSEYAGNERKQNGTYAIH